METEYVCCFTGHRSVPTKHVDGLCAVIDRALDKLINIGTREFRTGGAMGFDTFAALKVIEKKSEYPDIRLTLYLPCRDQTKKWSEYNKQAYAYVLERADEIIYTSETYSRGCMLYRNRCMVDGSDFCLGYCTSDSGGTAYTLEYAKKKGLRVLNLATLI